MLNNAEIRSQFPILKNLENNHPLTFLDSGATSQKPQRVIDAITTYYTEQNANVHRGVYGLSERATEAFEGVREKLAKFINAKSSKEIIFTKGATEAINLVAHSWGGKFLEAGDEVIVSEMEHHSNLVPWQLLEASKGIKVVKWPVTDKGELNLADLEKLINSKTKLLAITAMSNALGTINPLDKIIKIAHKSDVKVMVDGAQATSHLAIDAQALDLDFYAISGHKMYGPTGVGVLYAKEELLEAMPPFLGGGDMIAEVSFAKTTFNILPYKFEAGTPPIAEVIGLGAALDFIEEVGFVRINQIEDALLKYATEQLLTVEGLRIIGQAESKGSVISFVIDGAHPYDLATLLDQDGVAVRASHHCAMPLMTKFKLPATVRASFAVYNTLEEVDILVKSLKEAVDILV